MKQVFPIKGAGPAPDQGRSALRVRASTQPGGALARAATTSVLACWPSAWRAALLATACALAACQRAPAPPVVVAPAAAAPVTITALIWAPDWPAAMQQTAAEFSRRNPDIRVELQFMSGNSVEENLQPRVAARTLPDLVSVNPNPYAAALADRGMLADIGASTAWQHMRPKLKSDWMSPNGKHFGVAGGVAASLIYYNKAMFHQAGIERLPTDFDQFLDVCARLKRAGFTPIFWSGGFPNLIANGAFSAGFANNIVPVTPDWRARIADGTLELDNAAGADIFVKIRMLARRGYTQAALMQSGDDDGVRAFVTGKTAMAFHGSWAAGRLMHARGFDTGVMLPPWNVPGTTSVPVIGSETGFAVSATPRQGAALRFLDYLSGAGFAIAQKQRHNIAPFETAGAGTDAGDARIAAYVAQIERAAVSGSPYYSILPAASIELLHRLIADVLTDTITPRQAARRLEASIRNEARKQHK